MLNSAKSLAALLPETIQNDLKRFLNRWRIRRGSFDASEPEYDKLGEWLSEGDWAIDVGANVGHYTYRMSALVGPSGRVLAFEPILTTFALLASNLELSLYRNVSLFNVAASDSLRLTSMEMPTFKSGLKDYYEARIVEQAETGQTVMTLAIDSLSLPKPVRLIKVDAEGHEPEVVAGMRRLIAKDRPVLILETVSDELRAELLAINYDETCLEDSPNRLFTPNAVSAP